MLDWYTTLRNVLSRWNVCRLYRFTAFIHLEGVSRLLKDAILELEDEHVSQAMESHWCVSSLHAVIENFCLRTSPNQKDYPSETDSEEVGD